MPVQRTVPDRYTPLDPSVPVQCAHVGRRPQRRALPSRAIRDDHLLHGCRRCQQRGRQVTPVEAEVSTAGLFAESGDVTPVDLWFLSSIVQPRLAIIGLSARVVVTASCYPLRVMLSGGKYLLIWGLVCLAALAFAKECTDWNTAEFFETASLEVVADCLNSGADVHARAMSGFTPLHIAATLSGDPAIITALLDAGADANARNESGRTPLHLAAVASDNPTVISALIEAGADVHARAVPDLTPLHFAAGASDNPAVIEVLVEAGADLNARGADGLTPLHVAAGANTNPAIIATLLRAGADADVRGDGGLAPLHVAATINDNPAIISALLRAGVEVNVRTDYGTTPLHAAAESADNPAVIALLLDVGADASARDFRGKTPWDYAKDRDELRGTEVYRRLGEERF